MGVAWEGRLGPIAVAARSLSAIHGRGDIQTFLSNTPCRGGRYRGSRYHGGRYHGGRYHGGRYHDVDGIGPGGAWRSSV